MKAAPRPRTLTAVRAVIVILLSLVLMACADAPGPSVTAPPAAPTTSTPPATTIPASTTTLAPTSACPGGDVMLTDGQLVQWERPEADGTRIAGVSWRMAGECQVVTLSFATDDGAPATTPPTISARIMRSAGIVRIETTTTSSVVVDQLVEQGAVRRMFVPTDTDGNRFVDLVLDAPVVGRARLLTSPARLEIEMQPGGPPDLGSPLVTNDFVLVEPGVGATVSPVIDVSGYIRGEAEALTVAVLRFGLVVTESSIEPAGQPGVWTGFAETVPMGDEPYDMLQVLRPDGSVLAGIPFSP